MELRIIVFVVFVVVYIVILPAAFIVASLSLSRWGQVALSVGDPGESGDHSTAGSSIGLSSLLLKLGQRPCSGGVALPASFTSCSSSWFCGPLCLRVGVFDRAWMETNPVLDDLHVGQGAGTIAKRQWVLNKASLQDKP